MPPAVPRRLTFSRGFTLTEMAVVLLIVALLIAGMMIPLTAQQDIRARQDTEKALLDIREALIGFAIANGRLPRPATAFNDGSEAAACASDAACSGFIPWVTLGVQKMDSWGKIYRYSVTPAYANAAITLNTVANRTVRVDAAIILASQVPAVIFSHGKERHGTTDSGIALADGSATNLDEDANDTGPTTYYSRIPSPETAGGGEFDDLVVWLPGTILTNRMISAGRLP